MTLISRLLHHGSTRSLARSSRRRISLGLSVLLLPLLVSASSSLSAGTDSEARQTRASKAATGSVKAPGSSPQRTAVPRSTSSPSSHGSPSARDTRQRGVGGTANPGQRTPTGRVSRPGSPHYPSYGHGYYRYPYYRYPYFGLSYYSYPWGWGPYAWYWGAWGPYAYYPSAYWGHPTRVYYVGGDRGGLDLNVKPRKSRVYVDGIYVGLAKNFDGYPSYLWLDEGTHELAFFHPEHQTMAQRMRVNAGAINEIRVRLEKGEAILPEPPPRQVPEPLRKSEAADHREASEAKGGLSAPPQPVPESLDLRAAPARLIVKVRPDDASIYLDGRLLGSAAELSRLHADLVIDAGRHTLEVVRPGFEGEQIDFSLEPGGQRTVELSLTPSLRDQR